MTSTVTRTARAAGSGAQQAGRTGAQSVARGAARKIMSDAGNAVLGAVVGMAVSRVDRVADRLDGVADGSTGLREALTGRPAAARSDRSSPDNGGTAGATRLRGAFGFVVAGAIKLMQFLQRLALQALDVMRRLARRPRADISEADIPEPEEPDVDEEEPARVAAPDDDNEARPAPRRPRRTRR